MDPITWLFIIGALGLASAAVKGVIRGVPAAFLASLAQHESANNPNAINPASNATGLYQITATALNDYNRRHGTVLQLHDLLNPATATVVAADHIKQIVALYKKRPSLKPDWKSHRVVALIVQGWNSGHSGVSQLAAELESRGMSADQITVDSVSQLAAQKGVPYISEPGRVAWAKAVTSTYLDRRVA